MNKKIIVQCCEQIVVDEKDLKEGVYKKKGYEFELKMDSELKFPSFLFSFKPTQVREFWKRFKLQEDIVLKHIKCPICDKIIWMNNLDNDHDILSRGYHVLELKKWITGWRDFCPTWY